MNLSDISIIICHKTDFILPVLNTAFDTVVGKYSHLQGRYLDAIVLSSSDKAMTIVEVNEVEKISSSLFGLLTTKSRISFVFRELQEEREYVYEKLSDVAISRRSYSVWGQFYDTKEALQTAILKCGNFRELVGVMNIDSLDQISKEVL